LKKLITALSLALLSSFNSVYALPTGENVQSGSAEFNRADNTLIINQTTPNVAIDWDAFNIAKNELVRFNQNGGIALNRVIGLEPSQLFGRLQSDGAVYLINPNGIIFGRDFVLDTGHFYASTKMVDDEYMRNFVNTPITNLDNIISFEPDAEGNIINTTGMLKADTIVVGENGEIQLLNSGNVTVTGDIESSNLAIVGKNVNLEEGSLKNTGNLSLGAMRNLTVKNNPIVITAGDVKLTSDKDKDYKGMTSVIGSDITVDGNLTFDSHTTGTYFAYPTNEGNIDVGEHDVAFKGNVEVDNSTLNIKTKNIIFESNVDSANSYEIFDNAFTYGSNVKDDPKMITLAKIYYENYLKNIVYKGFSDLTEEEYNTIKIRCMDQHTKTWPDTESEQRDIVKVYYDTNVRISSLTEPTDFDSLTTDQYTQLAKHILTTYAFNKTENRESILNNWNNAVIAAKEDTNGGDAIGDKYLATVTDSLENWRITSQLEGKDYQLLLGGRTYNIVGRNIKSGREFYWVTGIEGTKGNTKFFTSSDIGEGTIHTYTAWSKDPDGMMHYVFNEPNNDSVYDQPYVAIGYHNDNGNGWADVENMKNTVRGFVQETNNSRSTINVTLTGNHYELGKVGDSVPIAINYITPPPPDNPPSEPDIPPDTPVNPPQDPIDPPDNPQEPDNPIDPPDNHPQNPDTPVNPPDTPQEPEQPSKPDEPKEDTTKKLYKDYDPSSYIRDAVPSAMLGAVIFLDDSYLIILNEKEDELKTYGKFKVYEERDKIKLEQIENKSKLPDEEDLNAKYHLSQFKKIDDGLYKIKYNGSILDITPLDNIAKEKVKKDDATNNVDVVSKALHLAFNDMGIEYTIVDYVIVHID